MDEKIKPFYNELSQTRSISAIFVDSAFYALLYTWENFSGLLLIV
jgi:hypothetical protein